MTGLQLLACPDCSDTVLAREGSEWVCGSCAVRYPELDGIPWLLREPQATLGEWRDRLHRLVLELGRDAQKVRAELQRQGLRTATRNRLKLLAQAYDDHARRLLSLLAPLQLDIKKATLELHLAMRTRLPPGQDLTSYYVNLHRDWVWGEEENEASFGLVSDLLQPRPPGRVLVLGAGGGRLAYDLHQRLNPELTIAADINPLLLLVLQRIVRGGTVSLYEFPIAPRRLEDHAILRRLGAPAPVRPGFHAVFGDGLRAPFLPESFDTVVTPWFVDIIATDLADLVPRINRLLKPGGRWINFGSLAFSHAQAALCYTLEEALEVVQEGGFACAEQREVSLPYMKSPASRHSRVESVVAFAADKVKSLTPSADISYLPEWIRDDTRPVPLLPQFRMTAAATRIYAFIMSLIDGQRSLRDIAGVLVEQRLMTPEEAGPAVRAFVTRMHEEAAGR